MQRRCGFVVEPGLAGHFLCSNNIFHLLIPPRVTFLPLFASPSRSRPHTRAADEATTALNRRHSTSASAVHSGSSRNKDDTLSAKVFLASLSLTLFGRISQSTACRPCWFFQMQLQTIKYWSVLHLFWHERPTLNGTSQLKICRNQWVTSDPTNLCTRQARSQGGNRLSNSAKLYKTFRLISFWCISQWDISVQINETA